MRITPQQIRSEFIDNKIQKSNAITNLISIIEKGEDHRERVESMKILGELKFKDREIYNLFESLLISEKNEKIRKISAEIIGENFLLTGLKPLIWALHHESVKPCLDVIYKNIIKALNKLKKQEHTNSKAFLLDLLGKINKKEFNIPLDDLQSEKDLKDLPIQELTIILINYFTIIYLEKAFWRIKYKIEQFRIIKLNFMFKGLTSLPEALKYLDDIRSLIFRYNQITSLPEWIGRLKKLKVLNLNINELYKIPESIGKIRSLEELYLWKNNLENLPSSIGSLKKLKIFNARLNYLSSLPSTIGHLKNLEILNLHDNKLVFLPKSTGNLKSLKVLNLSWNKMEELPDSIGSLSSLKKLDLGKNKLTTLPNALGDIISLETLNLSENQLSTLPNHTKNLKNLESINLFRNQLNELPKGMEALTNLKEAYFGGNRLDAYSEEVMALKSKGVKIYF